METPTARVRGLGSAKEGGHHWWTERMSSVAAFFLYVWLIVSVVRLGTLDYATVTAWLRDPLAAVPMLLLVFTTFLHLRDGLQVAIEDYVHDEGDRFATLLLLNFFAIGAGALAAFCVLQIALGGGAAAAPLR
ncbi:MAG TPA: succinate dehydrogenase, hydrophobic membrane anchor protein [Allosphingosinicella sp.]